MSPNNSNNERLLTGPLSEVDFRLLRQRFHIAYQELHWEMRDTIALCIKNYWFNVSEGGFYGDFVNNLLNTVEPIVEQEQMLLWEENMTNLFLIWRPDWYMRALESIENIRKYHWLLLTNSDFAYWESTQFGSFKLTEIKNPYRTLYVEAGYDKSAYLRLVESLPFSEVVRRHKKWCVTEIIDEDSGSKFDKAVNE